MRVAAGSLQRALKAHDSAADLPKSFTSQVTLSLSVCVRDLRRPSRFSAVVAAATRLAHAVRHPQSALQARQATILEFSLTCTSRTAWQLEGASQALGDAPALCRLSRPPGARQRGNSSGRHGECSDTPPSLACIACLTPRARRRQPECHHACTRLSAAAAALAPATMHAPPRCSRASFGVSAPRVHPPRAACTRSSQCRVAPDFSAHMLGCVSAGAFAVQ